MPRRFITQKLEMEKKLTENIFTPCKHSCLIFRNRNGAERKPHEGCLRTFFMQLHIGKQNKSFSEEAGLCVLTLLSFSAWLNFSLRQWFFPIGTAKYRREGPLFPLTLSVNFFGGSWEEILFYMQESVGLTLWSVCEKSQNYGKWVIRGYGFVGVCVA